MDYNRIAAKLTGYISGMAKYDTSLPVKARKEILEYLIILWENEGSEFSHTQIWVKEWEESLKEISA